MNEEKSNEAVDRPADEAEAIIESSDDSVNLSAETDNSDTSAA